MNRFSLCQRSFGYWDACFEKNPRMKGTINHVDRMGKEGMKEPLATANCFLERL
jgi:hypothetical protein